MDLKKKLVRGGEGDTGEGVPGPTSRWRRERKESLDRQADAEEEKETRMQFPGSTNSSYLTWTRTELQTCF
jgi:hypothetical protein